MIEHAKTLLMRDLTALAAEIQAFPDESKIWETSGSISNSAGNLCLHLLGNLNHFIGAGIGKNGYQRNREAEFGDKNIPKTELLRQIEATSQVVAKSMDGMKPEALQEIHPFPFSGGHHTNEYMLMHIPVHFGYHLGQINYLRRLM